MRQARLFWLEEHRPEQQRPELGPFKVLILDATNYDRPKTRTVEVGYVRGASGMRIGHGLSRLSERIGEGSWTLPLEIAWLPPWSGPLSFGVAEGATFVARHGCESEPILAVDAQYTAVPFLRPVRQLGVNVLGRVRSKRCFYLPPPTYAGQGRPRVRERKIKLEVVATVFWLLWVLRSLAAEQRVGLSARWRRRKLTPGAMRRLAAGLLLRFGWENPQPKLRGKSPGRTEV